MSPSSKKSQFGKTIITPMGRLIFPSLSRATSFQEGQEKKFTATIVCNPGPKLDELGTEVRTVGQKAFAAKFEQPEYYKPICDGAEVLSRIAEPTENTMALYTGRMRVLAKGSENKEPPKCYIFTPGSKVASLLPRRPGNEQDLKAIEETFYAGCFCRLAVTPFSFVTGKNKGVGLILKGIQFIKDGERIGGANLDAAFEEDVADDDWGDEVSVGFSGDEDTGAEITDLSS